MHSNVSESRIAYLESTSMIFRNRIFFNVCSTSPPYYISLYVMYYDELHDLLELLTLLDVVPLGLDQHHLEVPFLLPPYSHIIQGGIIVLLHVPIQGIFLEYLFIGIHHYLVLFAQQAESMAS